MAKAKSYIEAAFGTVAVILSVSSAFAIMNGNWEAGLIPTWTDFAISNPVITAFVLVLGLTFFGTSFVTLVENS